MTLRDLIERLQEQPETVKDMTWTSEGGRPVLDYSVVHSDEKKTVEIEANTHAGGF